MLTIGVDVGGTGIKSALIEIDEQDNYKVLDSFSIPTQGKEGADVIINNIVHAIKHFDVDKADTIGVASAGTIDWDSGDVIYATDALMGFTGVKLSTILSQRVGKRVVAVNDAVGALIGECFEGAGKKGARVMMFTLGTGLGASLLQSRHLDKDAVVDTRLGHICLHEGGRTCFCGKKGCAEQYVSATALKVNAKEENLYKVFTESDIISKTAVSDFIKDFIKVLSIAIEKYKPDLILVGGGVIELRQYWWQNFIIKYNKECSVPIIPATLGNKAGVVGAAVCVNKGRFENQ